MNISFPNNFLTSDRQLHIQNLKKVSETGNGKQTVPSNNITAETGVDKEENDRLLRKMQFAQTKAEVLGHYLGAMQTAVQDSGASGFIMLRRTHHLMGTQMAFQETAKYKDKKDQDTFLLDQIEALEKRQDELEEMKKAQAENQKEPYQAEEQSTKSSANRDNSSGKVRNTSDTQQNRSASNVQNVDLQKKAAMSYKTKDAPSRNPTVQNVFSGMI